MSVEQGISFYREVPCLAVWMAGNQDDLGGKVETDGVGGMMMIIGRR